MNQKEKLQETAMKMITEDKIKPFTEQNLEKVKKSLSEDEFKQAMGSCLLLFTDVFTPEEVEQANEGRPLDKEKVLSNVDKLIGLDCNEIVGQIYRMTGKYIFVDDITNDKYMKKYKDIIKKLYDEEIILDMNNIEQSLKDDLISNGYEDDFKIDNWEEEDVIVYQIPFVSGPGDDMRVSYNYICFYKNKCKCFEMDYDVYDLLTNDECLPLNYNKIVDTMFDMGIA